MSTITAISTPMGHGGIGIVRVSGKEALTIVKSIFQPIHSKAWKPYTFQLGYVIDETGKKIDQVLVSYFKAPKTYTGEDVCEINCHGGLLVTKQILELLLRKGAVLAKPGEFTERAFLNGKIDLTQAEAVMDLIQSKSTKENAVSMQQLEGVLGSKIRELKEKIIALLVDIEANIDYPEYDVEEVQRERMITTLEEVILELSQLEKSFENGKVLREGVKTAIIGKPNVGKSSLLNALLRENRAIVTEIAGTTRDTIEEYVTIQGIPLQLIDTAGIHETEDLVETIGIEKSRQSLQQAELVLLLLDGSQELTKEDHLLLQEVAHKKHIVLVNKIDLGNQIEDKDWEGEEVLFISIKQGLGLEQLESKIGEMFASQGLETDDGVMITNERHQSLIRKAREELEKACQATKEGVPVDMVSIAMSQSIQNLGEITGETVSEEVIQGIFAKFCLGK